MASERPEYNDKIRLMSALAPIAYMSNMTNPFFQLLSNFHNTLEVSWVSIMFYPRYIFFEYINDILK